MAKGILRGDFADGDEITIDAADRAVAIRRSGVGAGNEEAGAETASYY